MIWSGTILDGIVMCVLYPLYIGLITYSIFSAYLAGVTGFWDLFRAKVKDRTMLPGTEHCEAWNGALRGVEHKGVDAAPCHPGTLPGVAADHLPPGGLHLRGNRNVDPLRE